MATRLALLAAVWSLAVICLIAQYTVNAASILYTYDMPRPRVPAMM